MNKIKSNLLFIILVLAFLFLSIFSTNGWNWNDLKHSGDAITSDEVAHIGSGYYYLTTGKYYLNPEHPPLIKDVAALPLLFINLKSPQPVEDENLVEEEYPFENMYINENYDLHNSQWHYSEMLIFGNTDPDLIVFLSRVSLTIFNTLLLGVLYFFTLKIFSKRTALILLFIIAFSPFLIVNASLVIMDFTSSILQVIALILFALLLKSGSYKNKYMIWTIGFTSLALLAKFSSALLLPVIFLGGLLYIIFKKQSFLYYIKMFSILSIATMLLMGIFYAFHVMNMTSEGAKLHFDIHLSNFKDSPIDKLFEAMVSINIPVIKEVIKGIAYYLFGVLMVVNRIAGAAQRTYFLGGVYGSEGAGITYFPVLFLTKIHPAILFSMLGLSVLTIIKILQNKLSLKVFKKSYLERIVLWTLLLYVGAYMAYTFRSPLQIGLRHIMPVIFILLIFTAIGLNKLWDNKLLSLKNSIEIKVRHVFLSLGILVFVSCLLSFPNYLAYYNIFGGGTDNGYKIATDSNYDWGGQDLKRLGTWVEENEVDIIYTQIFTNASQAYYLGEGFREFDIEENELPPSGSYLAVSVFEYMNNVYSTGVPLEKQYTSLDQYRIDKVGKTIYIYKMP